jgi:uncharacterized coiled-coil protein SlyX
METIYTVIITIVTVLGSEHGWKFLNDRAKRKEEKDDFIKDDCRERISKLEYKLDEEEKIKSELILNIIELTKQVSSLQVKVEFLIRENEQLKNNLN